MRFLFLSFVNLFFVIGIFSKAYSRNISFTKDHQIVLQSILNISDSVTLQLDRLKSKYPHNISNDYLIHYFNLIQFLRYDKESDYNIFIQNCDSLLGEWNNEEINHFFKAEILFHKSLIEAHRQNIWRAFSSFMDGYRIINEVKNSRELVRIEKKYDTIFLILFDQLPNNTKWLLDVFGNEHDTQKGFEDLRSYSESLTGEPGLYEEALLIEALMHLKFNSNSSEFYARFRRCEQIEKSPLLMYLQGWLSFKNVRSTIVDLGKPSTDKFPLLYYTKGRKQLSSLNGSCIDNFNSFLNEYEGNAYKADALFRSCLWAKLDRNDSLLHALQDKLNDFEEYVTSNDKQAAAEVKYINATNRFLIQSRLLFDGGNIKEAHDILTEKRKVILKERGQEEEYFYRLGRVYQQLTDTLNAINCFKKSLQYATNSKRYFGPKAAFEIANYHYGNGSYEQSLYYLNKCDRYNNGEYKSDIRRNSSYLRDRINR